VTATGDLVSGDSGFHAAHEAYTEQAYRDPGLLPDRYVFVLTNRCNLRCAYCCQRKRPGGEAMTASDWVALARQVPEHARITLTGGEPFLFEGFDEVFAAVAATRDCNIITNGLLLDGARIERLLSFPRLRVLSLSIDDVGNRARSFTAEQWRRLVASLHAFRRRRDALGSACALDVKTTILDGNAADLLETYRFLREEIRVDTHAFQFLKGSPLQHADEMHELREALEESHAPVYARFETIVAQLEEVRRYNRSRGLVSYLHPKVASLTAPDPLPDLGYVNSRAFARHRFQACRFPWSSVHVNSDGTLFPCLAVALGNVRRETLVGIMRGEARRRFLEVIRAGGTIEACNRCGWIRPLSGVAPERPALA
jgi:MoaA/NifB/PqqE/SkfB family radical SAM enzyme